MRAALYSFLLVASVVCGSAQTSPATSVTLKIMNPLFNPTKGTCDSKQVDSYVVSNLTPIQIRTTIVTPQALNGIVVNPSNGQLPIILFLHVRQLEGILDGDAPWNEKVGFKIDTQAYTTSLTNQYTDANAEFSFSPYVITGRILDFLVRTAAANQDKKTSALLIANIGDSEKAMEFLFLQNRLGLYAIQAVLQTTDAHGTVTSIMSDPILVRIVYKGNQRAV